MAFEEAVEVVTTILCVFQCYRERFFEWRLKRKIRKALRDPERREQLLDLLARLELLPENKK